MDRVSLTIRPAVPADAADLARLVNIAGEGLPYYLWSKMARTGQDPWEVGRDRAGREQASFSYRNGVIAEAGDQIVGTLIGYPLPEAPEPIAPDMPAMFVPLQELENLAPGTWYVNVLAVYEEHRGRGYGKRLLATADQFATEEGTKGLSIIVADNNSAAQRLYERSGYELVEQRPMVKDDWVSDGQNWLLLIRMAM
jgi:ribosomal protein S18 acetylase RimI-like enzyme